MKKLILGLAAVTGVSLFAFSGTAQANDCHHGPIYGGPVYGRPVYPAPIYGGPVYAPTPGYVVQPVAPIYQPVPVVGYPVGGYPRGGGWGGPGYGGGRGRGPSFGVSTPSFGLYIR